MSEERLLELLADRATEGLAPAEAAEVEELLAEFTELDDLELDLAAGAIEVALGPEPDEELPSALRERIESAAGHVLAAARPPRRAPRRAPAPRRRWLSTVGWLAAAGLAGLLLLRAGVERAADPSALRAELLAADAITLAWSATGDPSGPQATGDVVWSNERQAGVMRFRGLAVNDPSAFQYQLWIFDESRDERYPIDGGVFDVSTEGGDVLVTIDPKLPVRSPTLFAVTVEEPGGVVVSSRERIAVLATAEG